jgi:predicted ATPase
VGHPLHELIARLDRQDVAIQRLALGPLPAEATCEMLGDALGRSSEQVRDLAQRVSRHSGNNPLLIQQCVYHLHELGYLRFTPGRGWTWNLDSAEAAVIPADPVGMLLAKLQRLRAETRAVAQFASCIGDEFDVDLLARMSKRERSGLEAALYELSDEGLIAPCRAGFRFVHDRVREAAQSLLRTRWELARTDWLLRGSPEAWPLDARSGDDCSWAVPC